MWNLAASSGNNKPKITHNVFKFHDTKTSFLRVYNFFYAGYILTYKRLKNNQIWSLYDGLGNIAEIAALYAYTVWRGLKPHSFRYCLSVHWCKFGRRSIIFKPFIKCSAALRGRLGLCNLGAAGRRMWGLWGIAVFVI